ncbi:MAG: PIN domain-containing protein [Gemmataceae bacterium]|nr:PIN domain-containing protein [Gemmataceae bacterium]
MKRREVLIDAGPLVAIVSQDDAHHARCVAELADLPTPLLTCWPVLTEALWLVRRNAAAVRGLFRGFADGVWALAPLGAEALPWLEAFLDRYRNLRAQVADASLVYLAEHEEIDTVFTLDYRDFSVYRYKKNKSLKLIPAPGQ